MVELKNTNGDFGKDLDTMRRIWKIKRRTADKSRIYPYILDSNYRGLDAAK
jgi:hypothetical protein